MLTCFALGETYLMVEVDDEYDPKSIIPNHKERIRTCIRMNVPDVKVFADRLTTNGVEVNYQEHEWGTIAKFFDSDGNLCAFRDSKTFEKQVSEYQSR